MNHLPYHELKRFVNPLLWREKVIDLTATLAGISRMIPQAFRWTVIYLVQTAITLTIGALFVQWMARLP